MPGKLRRKSGEWELGSVRERATLVPCPVCKTNGTVVDQKNETKPCRWCGGIGGVTKEVYMAFQRWLRIVAAAKRAGRTE